MTDQLRPWTIAFHVAQNDGTVHGAGSHAKTGRPCQAADPNGKPQPPISKKNKVPPDSPMRIAP